MRLVQMKKSSLLLAAFGIIFSAFLKAEDRKLTDQTTLSPVIEVSLTTDFTSIEQFVQSLQAFDPSKVKNGIADLFSAIQFGQPELNDTGTRIYADKIQSVKVLFQTEKEAVIFAEACPKTEAGPSCVGSLFFLSSENGLKKWRVLNTRRFYTSGKYAGISAEVTSDVGTGYHQLLRDLVISVKISEGGRGVSSSTSESFRVTGRGQFSQISLH